MHTIQGEMWGRGGGKGITGGRSYWPRRPEVSTVTAATTRASAEPLTPIALFEARVVVGLLVVLLLVAGAAVEFTGTPVVALASVVQFPSDGTVVLSTTITVELSSTGMVAFETAGGTVTFWPLTTAAARAAKTAVVRAMRLTDMVSVMKEGEAACVSVGVCV